MQFTSSLLSSAECRSSPDWVMCLMKISSEMYISNAWRTSPRLGVIFDTISVKARWDWEWWCRWNCGLRVINAQKKGIFCHTKSIAMTPKSRDHMPTTSLWGVVAKWPTRAPKTKLILCPRDPQGYSRISLSLSGRILKEYWNIMSALTCGMPWGLENRIHWSARYTNGRDAKVSSFELYKRNPLSPHCGRLRGSSCLVIPGVVCELLQFAATQ